MAGYGRKKARRSRTQEGAAGEEEGGERGRSARGARAEGVEVKPASLDTLMERSFRLLAARARGVEELRRRLLQREDAGAELVEQVIARLLDYAYLNDEKFARDYSLSKINGKPMGRRRLERDLTNKHLPEALIQAALDELYEAHPEGRLIEEALDRRVHAYGLPKSYNDLQKIAAKLMRRGFDPGVVREQTGDLWRKAKEAGVLEVEPGSRQESDRSEELDALVEKLVRTLGRPKNFKDARKFSERLMRRGFSFESIRQKVDPLWKS